MTAAMVLAAGLGTRLRPLSAELPKPLLPIGDRPAVMHLLERLARAGISRAVINTHHLPEAFASLGAPPLPVDVIHEPEILGTAGGLHNAASLLGDGDVLVWNADIVADVDVDGLLALLRGGAAAALAAAPRPRGQGTLGVDASGRLVRLRGVVVGSEARGGDFLGVQAVSAALRGELPHAGCLVGDVYLPALRGGGDLRVLDAPGPWDDIGTVAAYLDANRRWLGARGAPAYVGAGARVGDEVVLEGSVVGAGASVQGRGTLRHCVIWPHARAEAPLEDAVVTSAGTLVRR